MCAQPGAFDAPSAHNSHKNGNAARFDEAMKNLAEAIAERKVEFICTAYLALRHADRKIPLREIPQYVDRAVTSKSGSVREMIVSAFSHRLCVMCSDGTMPCRTCDGSGTTDDFECPACDGLGFEICSFCAGAGWSDHAEIPGEIRLAAVHRRIRHVKKDLARLDKVSETDIPALVERLQPEERRKLAAGLLRLQARLASLAGIETDNKDEYAARFGAGAEKITRLLEVLRAKHPQDRENQ